MEASSFDVDAYVFVEIDPSNPEKVKEVLVPGNLLNVTSLNDVSSSVVLKRQGLHRGSAKGIPVLTTLTVDLNDFQILDSSLPPERIFAHAAALYRLDTRRMPTGAASAVGEKRLMDYSAGDQFFLIDSFCGKLIPGRGKYDHPIEVVKVSTGQVGFVPAACLNYYPNAKVVEEFEWTVDGKKVLNKAGDFFSIGHGTKEMTWDPDGPKKNNDLLTFGRNREIRCWGIISVGNLVELKPEELESWRRANLLPARPPIPRPRRRTLPSSSPFPRPLSPLSNGSSLIRGFSTASLPSSHPQCIHSSSHSEACNCQERVDHVAEFKRNNRISDRNGVSSAPPWRRERGLYHVGALGEDLEVRGLGVSDGGGSSGLEDRWSDGGLDLTSVSYGDEVFMGGSYDF